MVKCKECNKEIKEHYRFTDWKHSNNDEYGTYDECLKIFKKAIKEEPKGRFSIYDVSECDCGMKDEGILFNRNCPEYKCPEYKL